MRLKSFMLPIFFVTFFFAVQILSPNLLSAQDTYCNIPVENCSAAVGLVIDKSGSMADEENGRSTLYRVKEAVIDVIENLPDNQWDLAIATFPNNQGDADFDLTPINRTTKNQFIRYIQSLQPGGFTDIITAGNQIHAELLTEPNKPKFAVFFSDGEIVQRDIMPENINEMATDLKDDGIYIVTVGHRLSDSEANIMRNMASNINGQRAFINTMSGNDVTSRFRDILGNLCSMLPVVVRIKPESELMALNATSSRVIEIIHRHDDQRTYSIVGMVGCPTLSGFPDSLTLSPNNCRWAGKLIVNTSQPCNEGLHTNSIRIRNENNVNFYANVSVRIEGGNLEINIKPPLWHEEDTSKYIVNEDLSRTFNQSRRADVLNIEFLINNTGSIRADATLSFQVKDVNNMRPLEDWIYYCPKSRISISPGNREKIRVKAFPKNQEHYRRQLVFEVIATALNRQFSQSQSIRPAR